jgi:exopolysaccharide biosynthesis polyprenyl glycosylphosphotransferase
MSERRREDEGAAAPRDRQRGQLVQPAVLIFVDLVMLEVAFLVTYWFRFHAGLWPTPLGIPPFDTYLRTSVVVLLVFFGIFYAMGRYEPRGGRSLEEELTGLFKGVVLGSLLVLALAFFFRHMTYSRSFFGLFFLSCFVFLTLGRVLARGAMRLILRRGMGTTRLLLVGESAMRERVLRAARELPGLALHPVGWLRLAETGPAAEPADPAGPPCLGELDDVERVVRERQIDLVVLTLPFPRLDLVKTIAARLANLTVDLQFVPDLLELQTSRMRLTDIAGIPFISVREAALSGADRIVKRTFDIVCTAVGLLALAPLLGLLVLLVRLSSPGPILYRQDRVGRDGRQFRMLKFRSMRVDAEAGSGPVWTVERDPRVTPVGRVLRRFSLDELPQLWNVLRGDMSLVGPRPERQVFVEKFSQELPRYFERHRVRSGLTGWAQVHGLRGNTSVEERTLYDLHYVENWSLALDVKIILMTIHHVLRGENAY